MSKNLDKNRDKRLDNLVPKPFSKDNQPSPEAKSKGWERRREAQKILDDFMRMGDMTFKEIGDLIKDIQRHPEKHTVREAKLARYMTKEKFMTDWLDRHISKAPQEMNLGVSDESITGIKVEIINGTKNTGNDSSGTDTEGLEQVQDNN